MDSVLHTRLTANCASPVPLWGLLQAEEAAGEYLEGGCHDSMGGAQEGMEQPQEVLWRTVASGRVFRLGGLEVSGAVGREAAGLGQWVVTKGMGGTFSLGGWNWKPSGN